MQALFENIFLGGREDFEFIPIGMNCAPSHTLRKIGLRRSALPFDWNVTSVSSAITLIENDFDDFLLDTNLRFLPPAFRLLFNEDGVELEMKNDIITPAFCSRYNILFPHDYPKDHIQFIDSVKEKYDRRITKLRELLNSDKYLVFLHKDGNLNDWQIEQFRSVGVQFKNENEMWQDRLSATLIKKYPNLKFQCLELPIFINEINAAWRNVQLRSKAQQPDHYK